MSVWYVSDPLYDHKSQATCGGCRHREVREGSHEVYMPLALPAKRMSSSVMEERSHMPRKMPAESLNKFAGESNSAIWPLSMTQILS